jgi:bla regulator protein blaR1
MNAAFALDHLWQSTLFAIAAGLLTLVLRNNHARVRYSVWLVASVKFLIPFSLLVAAGERVGWPGDRAASTLRLPAVMDAVGQPFGRASVSPIAPARLDASLPALCFTVWLCGLPAFLLAGAPDGGVPRRSHARLGPGAIGASRSGWFQRKP